MVKPTQHQTARVTGGQRQESRVDWVKTAASNAAPSRISNAAIETTVVAAAAHANQNGSIPFLKRLSESRAAQHTAILGFLETQDDFGSTDQQRPAGQAEMFQHSTNRFGRRRPFDLHFFFPVKFISAVGDI